MADSKIIISRPNSSSPPPNCAICLGTFTNKCFSDSCMHQFCFKCLLEWSKIKPECPLCKQSFRRIIHNVKSNDEYDEHVVEITPPDGIHIIDNEEYLFVPIGNPQPSTRHHFHFRGVYHRRRRETATTSFRRSIYIRNLWVSAPPDVTGRYRDVSPAFYRDCPGARTRLAPWLNRELNAILYENTQLVVWLVDIIMDHLLLHHICSRTFRNLLYEYLYNKTDHFIHEFYNFMRSPFDMIGYDRNVIYTERPQSPPPYVVMLQDEASDDGNDSDVIIVGSINPEEPVVIDLVNTDSDEPILVSPEDPPEPIPISEHSSEGEGGTRTPVLPLKLRLKRKRQSREKKKEKQLKKRSRHHRSRSSSSSISSSSSSSSDNSHARYKRRKKVKKFSRKRTPHSSSCSETLTNVDIEKSSSDSEDNLPLSTLAQKKKHLKNMAKLYKSSREKYQEVPMNLTKVRVEPEIESVGNSSNMPGCSKYSSNYSTFQNGMFDIKKEVKEQPSTSNASTRYDRPPDTVNVRKEIKDSTLGSSNAPTCSKYIRSITNSCNFHNEDHGLTRHGEESGEDNYPQNLVKKRPENKSFGVNSGKAYKNNTNKRLRNLVIKKEDSSNMWYSYPYNNSSSSSED
ncbi:uncharacterized protein isoform X2 [Leptinotarsa decemlineata]|uniref:uncharacterized protein isoform X2 n=1 Tax=Leptinotarsa decemlineata TaxID=7539 RepID=UPI003D308BB2